LNAYKSAIEVFYFEIDRAGCLRLNETLMRIEETCSATALPFAHNAQSKKNNFSLLLVDAATVMPSRTGCPNMPMNYCFAIVLGSDVSFACGVVPIQKHRILSQSNVLTLGKEALREMKAAVEFANVASDKVGTFKDGHDTLKAQIPHLLRSKLDQ
jgi:hypothetical protein